jgi:molybdopterin converting factor small subunit
VEVSYTAQLRQAAGVASEAVDLDGPGTLRHLVERLGQRHGEALRRLVLDPAGSLQPTVLVFVGDAQVRGDAPLKEGDRVTLMSPIAGG